MYAKIKVFFLDLACVENMEFIRNIIITGNRTKKREWIPFQLLNMNKRQN